MNYLSTGFYRDYQKISLQRNTYKTYLNRCFNWSGEKINNILINY